MASIIERIREETRTRWTEAQRHLTNLEDGGLEGLTAVIGAKLHSYEARLAQAQYTMRPEYQLELGRWYARLELDRTADVADVKSAYQRLMRLYHPDRYSGDPTLERMATTLSQELSVAKKGLIAHLEGAR